MKFICFKSTLKVISFDTKTCTFIERIMINVSTYILTRPSTLVEIFIERP